MLFDRHIVVIFVISEWKHTFWRSQPQIQLDILFLDPIIFFFAILVVWIDLFKLYIFLRGDVFGGGEGGLELFANNSFIPGPEMNLLHSLYKSIVFFANASFFAYI